MPADSLLLFVVAGVILNLTPGPDVLLIVSTALRSGARAGMVAALGICAGCFVHIVAAAVGVSALVAASATAFNVLKWIGAAYLLYIGVRALASRAPSALDLPQAGEATIAAPLRQVFWKGFATNALNPKVALFFLAFLPQFIGPQVQDKTAAFLLLGLLFDLNALWVCLGWALAAAWLAQRVGAVQRSLHRLERVAGAMFIAFGLKLAFTDNPVR